MHNQSFWIIFWCFCRFH